MTGGVDGGVHITEPTNASRTMLMDLDTLSWDEGIAGEMGIPLSMLPEIRSSRRCTARSASAGMLHGVPIAGTSATSRPPRSARPACRWARPRTPTAPATSC